MRPVQAEETIETALATPQEAALLGVDTGLPLLLLSQRSLDADGVPVEWVRSVYRGDRYKFVTRLEPPEPGRVTVLVVTGTGTGVGKTVVTAALAALAASPRAVRSRGQAGPDRAGARRARRPRRGRRLAGPSTSTCTSSPGFPDPLAPAAAARHAGAAGPPSTTPPRRSRALAADRDLVLVEGAGGLLVRYDDERHDDRRPGPRARRAGAGRGRPPGWARSTTPR